MGSSSSALGCARPRMEEEDNPTSLPRIRHRRAGEGRRKRHLIGGRARKDSILSTRELLRSSADNISDVASSAAASPRKSAALRKEEVIMGKERLGFGEGGEKVVEGEMEEDYRGSPSFRYYFKDPIDKDVIDKQKTEDVQMDDNPLNSSEDSRSKLQNKVKGKGKGKGKVKRSRSKKKGTNAGCNLLSARGRDNHDHHHTSLARVAPIE